MVSSTELTEAARLDVDNIGGIASTSVAFEPGVTVLAGRNATNRTSLLRALMAALGSDEVALKGDADQGAVSLAIDGETYWRELRRRGDGVVTEGEPYLDDSRIADLFAFLLENNEARRAVERGDDLRDVIMRPVDTEAINEEIDRHVERRRQLESRLEELSTLEENRASLERQREELADRIAEKEASLAATEADLEAANGDSGARRATDEELEAKLDELSAVRGDLETTRQSLAAERRSVDSLETELADLRESLADLPAVDDERAAELGDEIDRLREQAATHDSQVSELQTVIQFNEEMLEDDEANVVGTLREAGDDAVTDRLVEPDESVVCWTCGSDVSRDQIEATLDRLRSLRAETLSMRNELREEIDELTDRRSDLETTLRKRERLRERIEDAEAELSDRTERIEALEGDRDRLEARVTDLETAVEELRHEDQSGILDLHKEANELEFDLGRLREEREETEERIADMDERLAERAELEDECEELDERLDDLRTRIDTIEEEAVEQFNTHMEEVLETLGYGNLDRIWIERTEREVRRGRRTGDERTFDLHVVRTSETGASYEDTIDHLSESEREVTGLVFALAGFLVHEVYETVPFIVLDSLEAIDSERIAALVDYISGHADYLVVALLPEDAQALDDDYQRVREI